jgi:hypothetical protein
MKLYRRINGIVHEFDFNDLTQETIEYQGGRIPRYFDFMDEGETMEAFESYGPGSVMVTFFKDREAVEGLRAASEVDAKAILQQARSWNDSKRIRTLFNSENCTYAVAEYIANQVGLTLWPDK